MDLDLELGCKLNLDNRKFYLKPVLFMAKQHPDEICTPSRYAGMPTYRCDEGQREIRGTHLFIFDSLFQEAGYQVIRIDEPWPLFCNAVLSIGTGNKKQNEMLVTVQYFPIDGKVAAKPGEIGGGWRRMTVLLRLQEKDGKVQMEQDDSCLRSPNTFESVPEARKRLKECDEGRKPMP